jgi:hypothetical protein
VAPSAVTPPTRVVREPTPIMFMRVEDDHQAIGRAWRRLEATLGSLRGRRMLGAFHAAAGEYWVCAQLRERDDPAALGLETATLPGGAYLRARLRGEPPAVYERIPAVFDELARRADPDATRPSLEHYRRCDEIDLLLPVS